ncbi:787_t:CDS:1, partial [Paraglomus brasilianum]
EYPYGIPEEKVVSYGDRESVDKLTTSRWGGEKIPGRFNLHACAIVPSKDSMAVSDAFVTIIN